MRRALVAALVLALAGCAGPGAEEPDGPEPALELALPVGEVAPNEGAWTDRLYLALPARLNATNPANVTILALLAGALPPTLSWNATLNGTGQVASAELLLWLDLQNSALQPGVGGDPGCTAALTLVFVANNTTLHQPAGCASAGTGVVEPGEHLLRFSTPVTLPAGLRLAPGDQVVAQVAFGLSFPQGVGYVLGGGDHPSSLRLAGLAEPVPPPLGGNRTTLLL